MPNCPHCGTANRDGDRFCAGCGQPLSAGAPASPASLDSFLEAGVVCPACDAYNEPHQKACVACGAALSGMTGYMHAVDLPKVEEGAAPSEPAVPEPAAVPAPPRPRTAQLHSAAVEPPAPAMLCPTCRAQLSAGARVCLACAQPVPRLAVPPEAGPAPNLSIRLRLVRGYGREDSTYPVGPAGLSLGRSAALVNVPDDPFLSPSHVSFRLEQGQLTAEDLGSLNGTFVRIRGQVEIKQGAEFIAGNQRFALLGLGGPTTDVRMPVSQDTRPYGGAVPKQLFVALRLHHATPAGRPVAGSVILRCGPIISVGSRGCDLNFPTDPAMSAHHFELHLKPTGIGLVEIGATSGVFVRIRRPVALQNGDEILVGDEILRVEIG